VTGQALAPARERAGTALDAENQEGPGLAPRALPFTVLGCAYARRFAKQSLQ